MKRLLMMTLGAMVLTASLAQAQALTDPYAYILDAAPANQREGAAVLKWKSDFTYETLKKGTNQFVCYDQSGYPLQYPYSIECTLVGNLERVAQNFKLEAAGDRAKRQALVDEAEKNGTRIKPVYGSMWYHLYGPDKEHILHHVTVALPGATTATTGLPESAAGGGAWIMNAGTSTAHLMVPGE